MLFKLPISLNSAHFSPALQAQLELAHRLEELTAFSTVEHWQSEGK